MVRLENGLKSAGGIQKKEIRQRFICVIGGLENVGLCGEMNKIFSSHPISANSISGTMRECVVFLNVELGKCLWMPQNNGFSNVPVGAGKTVPPQCGDVGQEVNHRIHCGQRGQNVRYAFRMYAVRALSRRICSCVWPCLLLDLVSVMDNLGFGNSLVAGCHFASSLPLSLSPESSQCCVQPRVFQTIIEFTKGTGSSDNKVEQLSFCRVCIVEFMKEIGSQVEMI